ncbi:MAG: asparaginase [Kiloniellales bacterium]|nr:asparaginase [Kiloniellales bacterium]
MESRDAAVASAETEVNPVLVEATRGAMVESRHRAAVAVVDIEGRVVLRAGEIERPVYARSAIKPLQALALVESGAVEAFGLGAAELSLACASHNGEPRQVETVGAWLDRIGCTADDLECGAHLPYHQESLEALLRSGTEPSTLHNNCSGKHAGFLSVARHLGHPTAGYIRYDHPVQQQVLGILETLTGLDLSAGPRGIDGCGIPVLGIPLGNLALAMARFARPDDQPEARRAACRRLQQALAAEPFMIAGSGRFCTRVIEATQGRALVKTGAEGVFCGALPELGLGFALKVDDGATRAAEVVCGRVLRRLGVIGEAETAALAAVFQPTLLNRAGRTVGELRTAADCPF